LGRDNEIVPLRSAGRLNQPIKPPPGLSRAGWLLLLALCLAMAFLLPAADGGLDPSFNAGVGPFNGVQAIPDIREQVFAIPAEITMAIAHFRPILPDDRRWSYYQYSIARLYADGS
jgi:hypothetical protein